MKWFLLIVLFISYTNVSAECSVDSGEKRISLLELYTSEGCSSCPPADKWLSQLEQNGFRNNQIVALAFHVDYWDYIGWKDRFAKAAFSERQRRAAFLQGSATVYTPQFMLNGADFRGWFRNRRLQDNISIANTKPAKDELGLRLSSAGSAGMQLTTTIKTANSRYMENSDIFIAIYEHQLTTQVKAGENHGRELSHDYVVRELYGPFKPNLANSKWQQETLIGREWLKRDAGIAAFVQNRNTGEVLQAASLKICS
ncbi:MAG: DUF1223 domain-containing protein [Nitrosomonadales bacterium]|nr:DUF1223 domain-containing protein [Nitrosomonadales bacterium]